MQGLKCFKVINKKIIHHQKVVLEGSLAFMQHFKFVNWWFGFLMSQTGYCYRFRSNLNFNIIIWTNVCFGVHDNRLKSKICQNCPILKLSNNYFVLINHNVNLLLTFQPTFPNIGLCSDTCYLRLRLNFAWFEDFWVNPYLLIAYPKRG